MYYDITHQDVKYS